MLTAWRESPARFRADANVEDDLARVGYRDRVVVELAQNAADAATRAGVPGRLELRLTGDVLTAANTGAPLDAAGVESISVARASAKRGQAGAVGRFGVGFAAVRSVSDEPCIRSSTGAVRWSATETADVLGTVEELAGELSRRRGSAPVMRLPFAGAGAESRPVPTGFTTQVVLPLRDATAVGTVREQLAGLDPLLLLSLPALQAVSVEIDGDARELAREQDGELVVLRDGTTLTRWVVVRASGRLPDDVRDSQPAEQAASWEVSWALPVDAAGRLTALPAAVPRVVRAPTPTDDPLTLPAVLVATYPLDASRRRVVEGPAADAVTRGAVAALAGELRDRPADPSFAAIVPSGLPDGAVDAALHAALLDALRQTAWLPVAADPDRRQRPREAVELPDPLRHALRDVVPGALPAGWSGTALMSLGVQRPSVAELVDALAGVEQEPGWWRQVYAGFDSAVPPGPERDVLGGLPVPLVDGRLVTGPRGVAVPSTGTPPVDLAPLGVRLAHPDAAHPLLVSLGASEATTGGLLDQPRVRAAVEASYDEDDPAPVAEAVLALVAADGLDPGQRPWLAELALEGTAGDWRPAGELLAPDGRLASWVVTDSPFGVVAEATVARWGSEVLRAIGVLDDLAVLTETDAVGPDHDLDDEDGWWDRVPEGAAVAELVAVRDLEQIRADAWPQVLDALAAPPLRDAVTSEAVLLLADGGRTATTSYTAWWLSSRPVLDGRRPSQLCTAGAPPELRALYPQAGATPDEEFLRAIGVVGDLAGADPDDVLTRLADPAIEVGRATLRRLDAWLAGQAVRPPRRVRAVRCGEVVVAAAADAVVVDAPDLVGLLGDTAVVPVALHRAAALADSLDLPLASELAEFAVRSVGREEADAVVHDRLEVGDVTGVPCRVAWRYVDGRLHVDGSDREFGLGRGRAWRDANWSTRHRRSEELRAPDRERTREDENDLDEE